MRDPLVLPIAAITCGILLCRWAPFSVSEAAWCFGAFCALCVISASRSNGSRWLVRLCAAFALVAAGALTEAWHRPSSPPEIDAGSREIVLLDGCVVEPSVFSPEREQFTLELTEGARARVSLARDEEATPQSLVGLQALHYGQRVEIEARVRPPGTSAIQEPSITLAISRGKKSSGLLPCRAARPPKCCRAAADRALGV